MSRSCFRRKSPSAFAQSPGSTDYGPLSVLIQYYATPVWGFTVPPGAFTPRPKVDSAVIRLEWKPGVPDAKDFTDFVHHAFGSRRKKLLNNLVTICPSAAREEIAHDSRSRRTLTRRARGNADRRAIPSCV